jgi:hypothetical protein
MGNVVDSSGKPILDSSGNPIKTGSADAAKVSKNDSTSGADILTPEQKKYFSSMDTNQSVFTEAEIEAVRAGGDESLAKTMEQQNEDAIAALGENADNAPAGANFERGPSDKSESIIQGPTRAQDQFTLRQTPATLMTGVPRQKFEYLATFRFASDDLFETIFNDAEVESLDQQIVTNQQSIGSGPPGMFSQRVENLKKSRAGVIDSIRRSLVFNIKQIDGPKVNFQYDTLNQYNRKRNVYRRVDYDPVSVRFYDTMNNAALKLFRYLYELNVKDGRNKSEAYGGDRLLNRNLYDYNSLTDTEKFENYNFGIDSSISTSTYPIKSLDLFLIHGGKYNLIRFVHPKIISMDHDVMTYESSQPIEIGMQFAYETVIYETLNYDMGEAKDITIDFDQLLENSLAMTPTPTTVTAETEGSDGTGNSNTDWTKLSTSIPDEQSVTTVGSGSNVMNSSSFAHDVESTGAAYGGKQTFLDGFQSDLAQMNADLSKISSTPFSDSINQISQEVYGATKSAVSGFGAGGVSGGSPTGGQANSNSFWGGLGDKFKSASAGDGKYNPDSKNYVPPKRGVVKDSSGKIIKDSNGNAIRTGTNS